MATLSLSELNKQERSLKARITSLRRQLRENDISKKDFDKTFDDLSDKLEKIGEEKGKLIGLPPMPPKPRRPDGAAKQPSESHPRFGLDAIKNSILGGFKDSPPESKKNLDESIPSAPPRPPATKSTGIPDTKPDTKADDDKPIPSDQSTVKLKLSSSNLPAKAKPVPKELPVPPSRQVKAKSKSKPAGNTKIAPETEELLLPPRPPGMRAPSPKPEPKKPSRKRGRPPKPKVPVIAKKIQKVPVVKEVPVYREKVRKVPVIKRVEVPVIKEVVKEVPIIKEVVREVKVPVIKEKVRKVPVIKEVKVPASDPGLAKKIEKNFNVISGLRDDMAEKLGRMELKTKEIGDLKKRIQSIEGMKSDLEALTMRLDKMDFQGLSHDIYKQFGVMKDLMEDNIKNSSPAIDPQIAERVGENTESISEIRNDFTRREEEIRNMLDDTKKTMARLSGMEGVRKDMDSLKARIDKIDFKGLTNEIYGQFKKMNDSVKANEAKTDELVEKMRVEVKGLQERVDESRQIKEHVDNLDIKTMRQDMESLKQKSQFIEKSIEKVDIEPLMNMIMEIEGKIETLKSSSALIIE